VSASLHALPPGSEPSPRSRLATLISASAAAARHFGPAEKKCVRATLPLCSASGHGAAQVAASAKARSALVGSFRQKRTADPTVY
jgi:hypothetical protein